MKKLSLILITFMFTLSAFAAESIEDILDKMPGMTEMVNYYSNQVGTECIFSPATSYMFEHPENVMSFVGVYNCGTGEGKPFIRISGEITSNGNAKLMKIIFVD